MSAFKQTECARASILAAARPVQATKAALLALLTPEERKVKRKIGLDSSLTFEDTTRALIAKNDPRADELAMALGMFQQALNAFVLQVMAAGYITWLASTWIQKRGSNLMHAPCFSHAEVESEIYTVVRRHALSFNPDRGANFFAYAYRGVFQALDHWIVSRRAPLELRLHERRACLQGKRAYTSVPVQKIDHLSNTGQTPRRRVDQGERWSLVDPRSRK